MPLDLTIGKKLPTKKHRMEFLSIAKVVSALAVDTESDPDVDLFLGCSMAFPGASMYFPIGHLEDGVNIDDEIYETLYSVLKETPLRVYHNAPHDLEQIRRHMELDLSKYRFADTMIIAHHVDENVPNKGLDYLHKYYTGGQGKVRHPLMQQIIDTQGWRYVPVALMDEYASIDAEDTIELFLVLRDLYELEYGPLFEGENP